MRTARTNGSTAYSYVYNGGSLSQMTTGGNTLYFAYDASGTPLSVTYNGTAYYYATNLQGDITAILNASGTAVVTYTYDAWGNILTTSGSMASTLGTHNPLRYRGYVYDTETGLYYLQSRYYDPEMGRFFNADALVATGQGLLGNNMFAYCRNNPVNRKDASGTEDVCANDFNQDNNHANDLGNPTGGGGGGNSKGVRSVGGKGWRGDQTWKQNVKTVADGGDVRELNGGIPTIDEAKALIAEARGVYHNFHPAHPVGGVSTHTYNHIHYLTQTGIRSTIEVQVHI